VESSGFIPVVAASISYFCSLLIHFNLNKYWNFKSFSRSYGHQARTYLFASVFFYIVNISVMQLIIWLNFNYLIGKITATCILVSMTFLFNKYITFQSGIRQTMRSIYAKFFIKDQG
jgi:putative flippase GtrA